MKLDHRILFFDETSKPIQEPLRKDYVQLHAIISKVETDFYSAFEIHPYCYVYQNLFLFIAKRYSIDWAYDSWCIHSTVEGHWVVYSI